MNKDRCINIACGDSFVEGWQNFDYMPFSPVVRRANLLGRLPLAAGYAEVVYSSHFLEHVPRNLVDQFLAECFRITKSGGRIRLVLPDLEEMCKTYLENRARGEHDKADFLVLEMLDQCVRTLPGGELGAFYSGLQGSPARHKDMIEFVRQRTGHEVRVAAPTAGGWRHALASPSKLMGKLEQLYCGAMLALLPSAFRRQNVSLAAVGERHAWIYDFYSVDRLLMQAGFANVTRVTATTSMIANFPFFPLDVTREGIPRKGLESMFIEALKP